MPMQGKRKEKGMTLLEVMLTLVLSKIGRAHV